MRPSGCPDVCGDAVEGAAWSPDGRTLVFTRTTLRESSTDPAAVEIWLVDLRTGSAHAMTHRSTVGVGGKPGSQDNEGGWSPDGRRIVFTHWDHRASGSVDQYSVVTMRPDGPDQQQVTPNDVNAGQPAWSPDGTLIAFSHVPAGPGTSADLYVVQRDGSHPRPLAQTPTNEGAPDWGPAPT